MQRRVAFASAGVLASCVGWVGSNRDVLRYYASDLDADPSEFGPLERKLLVKLYQRDSEDERNDKRAILGENVKPWMPDWKYQLLIRDEAKRIELNPESDVPFLSEYKFLSERDKRVQDGYCSDPTMVPDLRPHALEVFKERAAISKWKMLQWWPMTTIAIPVAVVMGLFLRAVVAIVHMLWFVVEHLISGLCVPISLFLVLFESLWEVLWEYLCDVLGNLK